MQVSAHWLSDYLPKRLPVHELAERLTMSVNEVDEIRSLTGLSGIVVAEVAALEPHPDADKLQIATVRTGKRSRRIVTGAGNLAVGEKVPLAEPGTKLPDGTVIGTRSFRGIRSAGMLCSPRELGIGEDHSGIWLLPADCKVGATLPQVLGSRHDSFELDVAANRPDLMGHLGISREAAATFGLKLKEPKAKAPERPKRGAYEVKIQDTSKNARFVLARIRGLKNRKSPSWLTERLISVGIRPINPVVDVTNFVMLEYGQPLHAYDTEKLTGVVVFTRPSRKDETLKMLDGTTRKLPKDSLVVADRTQALGLAGIMGGSGSEVTQRTSDVLIEAATFDSATIRKASRAVGLRTEASARFEKGLPADLAWPAIRRAVGLLIEITGGELVQLADTYSKRQPKSTVKLDHDRLARLLGTEIPSAQVKSALTRLGFDVKARGKAFTVTAPYWRPDVTDEADLIEEVARQVGFDKLPSAMPEAPISVPKRPPLHRLTQRLRERLLAVGLTEVMTHSLVGKQLLAKAGYPQELASMANPLSEDHSFLRGTMAPRHLEAVADNLRWRETIGMFEIGRVFDPKGRGKRPDEQTKLLATLGTKGTADSLTDVRGWLTSLSQDLRIDTDQVEFKPVDIEKFVTGRHFQIFAGRTRVGWLAEYAWPSRFKAGRIYHLSLSLDRLLGVLPEDWHVTQPSEYPPVIRDLSLFAPPSAAFKDIEQTVQDSAGSMLREIADPEEYKHKGRRSLTMRLVFGSDEGTLTDRKVNSVMKSVAAAVTKKGWKVRE